MSVKVAYILPSLEFGGVERLVTNLIVHANTLDSVLVAFKALAPFLESKVHNLVFFEDLGVGEDDLHVILGRLHIPRAIWVARRLASRIRDEKAEIAVGAPHVGALLLGLAKHFLRRRVLCLANLQSPASAYFGFATRTRLRRLSERLCLAYLCRRADWIIVPSDGVGRDLSGNFGVPARKVLIVHNGIDLQGVRRLAGTAVDGQWFDEDIPVILGVGRLTPEKGFSTLIEAFALLRERVEARLVIVGDGHGRGALETLASGLGIAKECALIGFRHNPFAYMQRSAVLVLPSHYEGLPHVLPEAMACGTPVVATSCPAGTVEIVRHGENGLLVPVGDPVAMANAIERVLKEPELRGRLVRGGGETAQRFEISHIVEEYEREMLSRVVAR